MARVGAPKEDCIPENPIQVSMSREIPEGNHVGLAVGRMLELTAEIDETRRATLDWRPSLQGFAEHGRQWCVAVR